MFALLISGYLRSFKENITNLQKYLLNDNNVDIYIHITKDKDTKYNNNDVALDEIYALLKPKMLIITKNFNFNDDININNILNENYKYYLLNEERKKIEKIEKIKYTLLIKIRPDVNLNKKINFDVNNNKICIPTDSKIDIHKLNKCSDKYICDIIAYGPEALMNVYFELYNELNNLIEKYGTVNETLLYYHLKNNNINYELIDINYIVILSLCNTIAITGDSGSGKTTISSIIKNLFINSFILECDRYHKWERNDNNWNNYTHLNPYSNYLAKMKNDVFNLKVGNNIYQVDYDHKTGKFTDNAIIESNENIIICGLHTLYIPDNIINLKIYIDTDENLKTPWKIKRDIKKRGYTPEQILKQINGRRDDYFKYIYPQKKNADLIINFYTNTIFDIDNFNINDDYDVLLKIGIRSTFIINNIIKDQLDVKAIYIDDGFIFFDFKETYDYDLIIKTFIINLQT